MNSMDEKGGGKVFSVSDNQLMEAVRGGQVEKLAVLFERHHIKLFNFMLRLTGNPGTAEDLVQEVFCRILKYRTTFRGTSRFEVWMYQIGRNAHIDLLRKKKDAVPIEEQYHEVRSPEPSPDRQAEVNQEVALMEQALARLPLKKREVLVLSRYQNMKYQEIAELLGCHIGTVKAHVHRAIKDLRKIYMELSGEAVS